ncbi:uncharacterized protein V6R79_016030 [Siganus canaliculatus]
MGDAQSAQREDKKDAVAEEESGKVDDAQTEQISEEKPLKSNGQITEVNGKTNHSKIEANGHCDEGITAEAILPPKEDISEMEKPLKDDETPSENTEINEKESSQKEEVDPNDEVPSETTEMDAKQNDINKGFKKFFSNIGLKLTVKKGSSDAASDETNKEETQDDQVEDNAKETNKENSDATTCPTPTDVPSDETLENAEEKEAESKEDMKSDNAAASLPEEEDTNQDVTAEDSTSPSGPEEEVVSPIKKFFTTGIFSGLKKKKKTTDDEITEKELEEVGDKEATETTEQPEQDQQQDKDEASPNVEATVTEAEQDHNEHKEEMQSGASEETQKKEEASTITTEPEILSSQEKDKVQASPLKRLLSGSSLKKLSKKQRSAKQSDAKLSDSGEHGSEQLLSSTESADNQKEEGSTQAAAEGAEDEDGAWSSFKKLVTPKKRMKKSPLSNEEAQGSVEEPKPSEGEPISDHSTEEGKKRKDSISWEAVLCGSGRRRSRKTSDSEDEAPQIESSHKREDVAESPLESSNENEVLPSSPKQAGSSSEGDGESTWKSFKRFVTPKRKAKEEDESKENIQSDSEATQEESTFSVKKFLSGQKMRKSAEKQGPASSDEANKAAASDDDEDSETPAVVPLSEFDEEETKICIQIHVDQESHTPEEENPELQKNIFEQMPEPVLPCVSTMDAEEEEEVQHKDEAVEKQEASADPAAHEEPDDFTESVDKYQQLSDIPEEGIITETLATEVGEEVARDDTIAEDLIEITSEAITAPEPTPDITMTDETEMVSAVSQLSSVSSKTSGNTTPVPLEYDVKETDTVLNQVVETFSTSPETIPVCLDERNTEKVTDSVLPVLETLAKEELEDRAENKDINVEELDLSEVPTEDFDTVETAVSEIDEVSTTHQVESLDELTEDIHQLVEGQTDSVSADELPEDKEAVADVDSLPEAHQETESPEFVSLEADTADKTEDVQEVQAVTEKEEQIKLNVTDQALVEDKVQATTEVDELQESAPVQAVTLDSEGSGDHLLEKEVTSGALDAPERDAGEQKEEIVPLSKVSTELEKEADSDADADADAAKTEEVPEESEAVPISSVDSEELRAKSPEVEVQSADLPTAAEHTDEMKQTVQHLTEASVESEDKELPVNAPTTELVEEPGVLETVAPKPESEESRVESTEEEVKSQDLQPTKTSSDEPEQTEELQSTEASVEPELKEEAVDFAITEHVQEPVVLETAQAPESLETDQASILDSEDISTKSPGEEIKSEIIPSTEKDSDEPEQTEEHLKETSNEPEHKEQLGSVVSTEHVQEPEVLETAQAPAADLVENSVKFTEEEVKSEDQPATKTSTDEPEQTEKDPSTEASVEAEQKEEPVDAAITEHVQELEVSETVQAHTSDPEVSRAKSPEAEVISEILPTTEKLTEESEQPDNLLKETSVEPVKVASTEHVQDLEVLETVQASASNLVENSAKSPEEEVKSEDLPTMETCTDEPQQVEEHPADSGIESEDTEQPAKPVSTEHVEEPETVKTCQAPASDLEESSVKTPEKEVKPEDLPPIETSTDQPEPTEQHQTSEASIEPEVKEQPADVASTEHAQEPEVLDTSQTPTSDPDKSSAESPEEEVKPEVLPPAEKATDEAEQTEEHLKETSVEADRNEQPLNVASTEHVEEPKAVDTVQAPVSDPEESSIKPPEEQVKSEDLPPTKTSTDELEQTEEHPADASVEEKEQSVNEATTELTEENAAPKMNSEEGSAASLDKQEIEDAAEVEKVTKEPQETTVPISKVNLEPIDVSETEPVQEPEAKDVETDSSNELSSEIKAASEDVPAVETAADEVKHEAGEKVEAEENPPEETAKSEEPESLSSSNTTGAVTETGEEKEALMNVQVVTDITEKSIMNEQPATDSVPVVDEAESETVCQELEIPESHPQGVQVEQQDRLQEVVEELPIVTAVNVPVVNEETTHVQTFEKSVETSAPCEDNAAVTDEPKHEQHLSVVQITVEQEKESELPSAEMKAAAAECAALVQEIDSNVKDVPVVMPNVLIEKSSEVAEPLIETVANELVLNEDMEAAELLATDVLEEVSVALMVNAPSMLLEENDRIQVQVVDVDINSDEVTVDAVVEVGISEDKEVKYVCDEADEEVNNILATPELEVGIAQHVQEKSSKAVSEAPVAILEEEVIQQKEVSEVLESGPNDKKEQKVMDDCAGTFKEEREEAPVVIGDESAAAPVVKDLTETPDISERLDKNKDNSEETKVECQNSEVHVAAEEVKSEDSDGKTIHEQVQFAHITQTPSVIQSNTDMIVPQNAGVIASTGNMEPPPSLCLEFKLNIQFGQGRIPGSPPLRRGRMTPVNLTDTSEVQAHAEVKTTNSPQRVPSPMQSELTRQTRRDKEPAAKVDSVAKEMIVTQPDVQEAGIQLMETVHLVEEVKSTERATSCVQAAETTQAIRPTEARGVVSEPKGEVLVKQVEEEKDQDEWMDAEEGSDTPKETKASQPEAEKPTEQEEKAAVAHEDAMFPESTTKEEDSQQEKQEEGGIIENGSEDEDFTVALEQPVSESLSLTPVE